MHLDVSPEESLRRINLRARDCESSIPIDYLRVRPRLHVVDHKELNLFRYLRPQKLHAAYEDFLKDIARIIPVIRVNYATFRSADEMADMVVR